MRTVMIPDRWEKIIALVDQHGSATVEQIASALDVSISTVRRDLSRIHSHGLIERTRGGAEPSTQIRVGPTLAESRKINPKEKEKIGRVAADLIEDGDTIMIDGGYTTYQVALNITAKDVTVITNSLDVAQVLAPRDDIHLVMLGGELSTDIGTTVGPATEQQISAFIASKAILGADAISPEDGISSPTSLTAQTKMAMIRCSREVIVVADYGKLGKSAMYRVAPAEKVTTIVTDDKAGPATLDMFRASGVEVIVASD